ncbi:MAG: hypothetical protein EB084_13910 [Proteobacteria bacterium]|nr:hypothetical protein [Pseudomonadota bacterium]
MSAHKRQESLADAIHRLAHKRIPRSPAYWIGARRPFGFTPKDGPLDVILWVDRETRETRCTTTLPTGSDPEAMAWELIHAIECEGHDWRPMIPAVVAVGTERDKELIRPVLDALRIDLVQRSHDDDLNPILDELVLEPHIDSFLDVENVTPEMVGRLFQLATEFYQQYGWAEQTLEISAPGASSVEVSITPDDAEPTIEIRGPHQPLRLLIAYSPAEEVSQVLLDDVRSHGWVCTSDLRVPVLEVLEEGEEEGELPHPEHIETAVRVLEALLISLIEQR